MDARALARSIRCRQAGNRAAWAGGVIWNCVATIGEGAFGEVFRAHDSWLDHPVALKLLKPEIAQTDYSARILYEARRLARVRHPNVVSVHGADMHDGRIGFWMDLIEGETLADLVAGGRLSAGEASHIGGEVCLALAAVHRANLVHRDVKAQNVMRASDGGRIILMDFGAGEFIGKRSNSGRVRGTPLYLAPEIFKGADATFASDIYSLGVLLYHLVTGGYPVISTSVASLVDAHLKGERRRLRDARPDLPPSFVSVVERAIDPDRTRRFASAGEFYAALTADEKKTTADGSRETSWLSLKNLRLAGAVVAGALVAAELLGLFASESFEAMLHVDPVFAAGATAHVGVGLRARFPFVLVWSMYAAGAALLAGLRALITRHSGPVRRWSSALSHRVDPSSQAGLIVCAAVLGLVGLTWLFWNVYYALTALALDSHPEALDLSILGPAGRGLHRTQVYTSTAFSFLLLLAVVFWFPQLERRATERSRVKNLKWAALAVAFLVVALEVGTRPCLWDLREAVSFENRQAFVIGNSGSELLLYNPAPGERRTMRVRADAPDLLRNVARVALFQPVPIVK